jgi:hypothetical protein
MPVTFDSTEQRECYQLVEDYLLVLELAYHKSEDGPSFVIPFDDVPLVLIEVRPWGDDDTQVQVASPVMDDAPLDEKLLRHLLEWNAVMPIGCFCVEGNSIFVRHGMGGSDLDKSELRDAVYLVANFAGQAGSEISERFGGQPAG